MGKQLGFQSRVKAKEEIEDKYCSLILGWGILKSQTDL